DRGTNERFAFAVSQAVRLTEHAEHGDPVDLEAQHEVDEALPRLEIEALVIVKRCGEDRDDPVEHATLLSRKLDGIDERDDSLPYLNRLRTCIYDRKLLKQATWRHCPSQRPRFRCAYNSRTPSIALPDSRRCSKRLSMRSRAD